VQQVTWSSQGDVRSVDICLYKDILLYSTLQHDAENSGSSIVTLPAGLLPGQYHLRVTSSDNRDVTAESATFEVTCTGPPPAISNVAPQQSIWQSSSQQQVTWSCQGEVPSVSITLCPEATRGGITWPMYPLAHFVENSGCLMIAVPAGLLPGQYYLQVSSSVNGHVTADSAAFEITCRGLSPSISSVALQHEEWRSGQVQQVTWSSQGDVPTVAINLYSNKQQQAICMLQDYFSVENSGSSMVTLPAGLLPGQYHLQVRSADNEDVTADSATFEVTCTGPPPAISNVAPQQPIWHSGSQQQVTWSCKGDVPTVNINLYRSSNSATKVKFPISWKLDAENSIQRHLRLIATVQRSAENSGRSVITVPTGLTPGKYHLEVVSSYKGACNREVAAESAAFTIDDEHRERCVRIGLLLLGLPPQFRLPYAIIRKIAVEAA